MGCPRQCKVAVKPSMGMAYIKHATLRRMSNDRKQSASAGWLQPQWRTNAASAVQDESIVHIGIGLDARSLPAKPEQLMRPHFLNLNHIAQSISHISDESQYIMM